MKEENKYNGKWPTDGMPSYTPPTSVWARIEAELDLQEALTKLPVHAPPAEAWSALDARLDGKNGGSRAWLSATALRWAAGIAILIGSAVAYQAIQSDDEANLEYRVEWATAGEFFSNEKIEPSAAESIVKQLCARAVHICESSDFKKLEEELYQLETARDEVQSRMNPYGDNDELERMLMQIELQHAEIVKQMTNTLL